MSVDSSSKSTKRNKWSSCEMKDSSDKHHKFTYTWTIENLAFWAKRNGEFLETDVFRPLLIDDGIWQLRLYPRGRDEPLLWYLERIHGDRSETTQLSFRVKIYSDGVQHYEYQANDYLFKNGSGAACVTEKRLKDIVSMASVRQNQDSLVVVCQMWRRCPTVALAEKLSSCTRIEIGRLTFSWHFVQFSSWDPVEQHAYSGYTYGNSVHDILSCKMQLYSNRDPADERLGLILRFRRPPTEDFLLSARIFVLDVHGKAAVSHEETYFEKAGDDTIVWVMPAFIDKKMLSDRAGVYLPNDELTLLSEFNIPVRNIYSVRLQYSLASSAALRNLEQSSIETPTVRGESVSCQTSDSVVEQMEHGTQTETAAEPLSIQEPGLDYNRQPIDITLEDKNILLATFEHFLESTFRMIQSDIHVKKEPSFAQVSDKPVAGSLDYSTQCTSDDCASKDQLKEDHSEEESDDSEDRGDSGDSEISEETSSLEDDDGDKVSDSPNRRFYFNRWLPNRKHASPGPSDKFHSLASKSPAATIQKGRWLMYPECTPSDENVKEGNPASETTSREDGSSEERSGSESSQEGSTEDSDGSDESSSDEDSAADVSGLVPHSVQWIPFDSWKRSISEMVSNTLHAILDYIWNFKMTLTLLMISIIFLFSLINEYKDDLKTLKKPSFNRLLVLVYAEALGDQHTSELAWSYSKMMQPEDRRLEVSKIVSNLSTQNAWVFLSLADAHNDSILGRTVVDFLAVHLDVTIKSHEWRTAVDKTMESAHRLFRERYPKKG